MDTLSYKEYLDELQHNTGWYAFAEIMIDMIMPNANFDEAFDFLQEAGMRLAVSNSIPKTNTLHELTKNINARLDLFKWGRLGIEDQGRRLVLQHDFLPRTQKTEEKMWVNGFAALLCGLYQQWLQQSGAPQTLKLTLDRIVSPSTLIFSLQKS